MDACYVPGWLGDEGSNTLKNDKPGVKETKENCNKTSLINGFIALKRKLVVAHTAVVKTKHVAKHTTRCSSGSLLITAAGRAHWHVQHLFIHMT